MIIIREAKLSDKEQLGLLITKWIASQGTLNAPENIDVNVLEKTGWSSKSPLCYSVVAEDGQYKWVYLCVINPMDGQPVTYKRLVGYALCTYNYAIWTGKGLLLENIFVEENYRRQAIGSRLLSAIFQHGLDKGCQQVNYYTQKDDYPAMKFFEKFRGSNTTESEGWLVYSMSRQAIEYSGR